MSIQGEYERLLQNPERFLRINLLDFGTQNLPGSRQRAAFFYLDKVQDNDIKRYKISTYNNPAGSIEIPVFELAVTDQTNVLTPPREMPTYPLPDENSFALPSRNYPAKVLATRNLTGCSIVYQLLPIGGGPFLAHILPAPTVTGSELQDWLEWGNGPWFQTTQTRTASVFGRNNYGYGTDVAHLVGIRSRNHWTFYVQYCQGDDLDNLYITGVRRLR